MFDIALIQAQRQQFIALLNELSINELNQVPEGFNNNIIWNFGHMVVSGYALMYWRTEANPTFQIPYMEAYKTGSKPAADAGEAEIENLKTLAVDSVVEIEADVRGGIFDSIKPFATKTLGVEMRHYEDVLAFIFAHDALHFATAKAMKRIIQL